MKKLLAGIMIFIAFAGIYQIDLSSIPKGSNYILKGSSTMTFERYQEMTINGNIVQRPLSTTLGQLSQQGQSLKNTYDDDMGYVITKIRNITFGGAIQGNWGVFEWLRQGLNVLIAPFTGILLVLIDVMNIVIIPLQVTWTVLTQSTWQNAI